MKKNIDKQIMDKIYIEETKKTGFSILFKIILTVFVFIIGIVFIQSFVLILQEQDTFSLFKLITEDIEILRYFFWEVMGVVFQEIPQKELIVSLVAIFILIVILVQTILTFSKTKNIITSLFTFWKKKKQR